MSDKQSNYGLLAGYCAGTVKNVTVTNSSLNVKTTNKTTNLVVVGGLIFVDRLRKAKAE